MLSLAFRLIGMVFLGFALVATIGTLRFTTDAVRLDGTVVDLRVEQNAVPLMRAEEETGLIYYPIVEYEGPDGAVRQFEGRAGRQRPVYEAGDTVTVLLRLSDPAGARIDSLLGIWGSSIILGGMAVAFLLVGFLAPLGFGGSRKAG